MKTQQNKTRRPIYLMTTLLTIFIASSSCQPIATPTTSLTPKEDPQASTITIEPSLPAPTIEPTPTLPLTPPALPGAYQSTFLNPLDTPRSYVEDTCQYLKNKWNPLNAEPGTVVMIIMIRGIYKGPVEGMGGMTAVDFAKMMNQLHNQEFEAINTQQFLAFMERNVKIPKRSVLIIQDGRHQGDNFYKNFHDYWEMWGWPVVSAWPSQPDATEELWQENIALEQEGWVDHQAGGVMIGSFLTDDTSKAIINRELQGSLDAFAERFNKKPVAFIWPGGGFGQRPVEAARQLGYQLGFTTNSRGPVMYNWVPQADIEDLERPAYIPEGKIGDPLMTLPRYWPTQVVDAIDSVRIMGKESAAYALANKDVEFQYYNIVCAPTYGPMPTP
jgi:hypothetical protein